MQTVILMLNNLVDDYYTNVFQYDSFGRLANITQTGTDLTTKAVDYVYNLNGQRTGATYKQNGDVVSESSWAYDAANRTTSIQHKKANDDIFAEYGLTWDAANRITEFETVDGAAEYTYDATGQLTGAEYDYITDESYSYDDNGNRTMTGYETGANNETLADGTYRYSYDAEGNQTEKYLWTDTDEDGIIDESEKTLVQTYDWDYRNRLESVTNYDSSGIATETIEYIYDYLNQMIARSVTADSTTTSEAFIYSNGQIVLEYDTTSAVDAVTAVNFWGANVDELVAVESFVPSVPSVPSVYWSYGDHLNTIRDVVSYNPVTETTTVVNHLIYDAFGNLVSSVDPSNNNATLAPLLTFRYTGKFFDDATGLQNNLNRWYDSTTGKWLSVDPIGFGAGDMNLYRYVGNNSVLFVDLRGQSVVDWVHTGLDGFGLIPGFGEIADGINACLYLCEGDYINAGLSTAAMVPFIGWSATATKWARNIAKHAIGHFPGKTIGQVEALISNTVEIAKKKGKVFPHPEKAGATLYVDDCTGVIVIEDGVGGGTCFRPDNLKKWKNDWITGKK